MKLFIRQIIRLYFLCIESDVKVGLRVKVYTKG